MKRFLAHILILAFGFLILPKDSWHDCHTNTQHSHKEQKSQFSEHQSDCDVCHMELFQLDSPEIALHIQLRSGKITHLEQAVQESIHFSLHTLNKGPPAC